MKKLILFLLLCLPALAQNAPIEVKTSVLERAGVHVRTMATLYYLDDSRTLIAMDTPPFTVKRTGIMARLWLLRFDSTGKLQETRKVDMRCPGIEQANLTPDLKSLVVISNKGTQVFRVDLASGQVAQIMKHDKGTPGYRIDPVILGLTDGKLYTIGTLYDAEDYHTPKQFAELDAYQSGAGGFKGLIEMRPIEERLPGLFVASELSPRGMFFGYKEAGLDRFSRWTPGGGLQSLDEAKEYLGSWGEQHRWLYSVLRQDNTSELLLADATSGEKRVLATSGRDRFQYPVLSKEGNTAVVATERAGGEITYWVAQDRDGYKLRPLLEKAGMHTVRISLSGETVVFFSPIEGLRLVRL